jgi:hypothetical protein
MTKEKIGIKFLSVYFLLALFTLSLSLSFVSAAPVTLFQDDFDGYTNTAGLPFYSELESNNWIVYDDANPINDDDIYRNNNPSFVSPEGDYYLVIKDDSYVISDISTIGYEDIKLSYYRRTYLLESNDWFRIRWRVGNSGPWTVLENMRSTQWAQRNWDLVGAENQPLIQIQFFLDNGDADYGLLDDVLITGEIMPPNTNITFISNYDYNSSSRQCVWDGSQFRTYINYNNPMVRGISVANPLGAGINTNDNSPQYVWSSVITSWTSATSEGNNGDSVVTWYSSQIPSQIFSDGENRVCGRAKDINNNQENPGSSTVNVWTLPNEDCCNVCIDTQAPPLPVVVHANPSQCVPNYVNEAPVFSWEPVEDIGCAGIKFYRYGIYNDLGNLVTSGNTTETNVTVPSPVNGRGYTIVVRAFDNALNSVDPFNLSEWSWYEEDEAVGFVYYDNELPTITTGNPFIYPQTQSSVNPALWWITGGFWINETDNDNMGLHECRIIIEDDGEALVEEVIDCNLLYEVGEEVCTTDGLGKCKVIKQIKDKACNVGSTEELLDVDKNPPVTTKEVIGAKYPGPNALWPLIHWFIKPSTQVQLTCDDAGSGCYKTFYRINSSEDWIEYTSPFNVGSEDGVYLVEYYSVDGVGWIEDVQYEYDKIDTIAPTTEKTEEPSYFDEGTETLWVGANTLFSVSAFDTQVGVNKTYYNYDSTEYSVDGDLAEFNLSGYCPSYNGSTFDIYHWAEDHLGNMPNETEKGMQTVKLDCVAPEIEVLNNLADGSMIHCDQSVAVKLTDDGSGVKGARVVWKNSTGDVVAQKEMVYYEGYQGGAWDSTFTQLELWKEGNYTIEIVAEDNVGNENTLALSVELPRTICAVIVPSACNIPDLNAGGLCEFTFYSRIRGGNAVAMSLKDINGFSAQNLSAVLINSSSSVAVGNVNNANTPLWNGGKLGLNVLGIDGKYGSASFRFSAVMPANVSSTFPLAGEYYLRPEII